MLVPNRRPIFLNRKHKTNAYRVVILLALIIIAAFFLRGYLNGSIKPILSQTPTPTRTVNSYTLEGETQFTAGNLNAAIEAYQKALAIDATNATTWAELARIQTYSSSLITTDSDKKVRMDDALKSINKAVELAPDESSVHAIKAFVLDWTADPGIAGDGWQGVLTKAEQEAVKALQLDNTNALALAYYAEILSDQAKWVQANQYITQALEKDPSLMDVHRINGVVQESLGNYTQAIAEYQKAIDIMPNLTFLYLRVGANYRELASRSSSPTTKANLYEQSLEFFAKAVQINTQLNVKDPIPYLSIAKSYSQMGEYFTAALNVKKALTFAPDNPDIYGQLGIVYYKSRNFEGAIPAFKCALEGCTAQEACNARSCNSDTDTIVAIEGMPLTDNTVVYYFTYGAALSGMHKKSAPTCDKAMPILAQIRAKYSADVNVMAIVEASENICLSYGYQLLKVTTPTP
jgi:tetratricopeptide (TPR) repeat protein